MPDTTGTTSPVISGLLALERAAQSARLYGVDHPAFRQAVDEAVTSFSEFARQAKSRITVADDHFLVGDDPLDAGAELALLAARLNRLDIAAIEFTAPPTNDDLMAFVELLDHADQHDWHGAELGGRVRAATDGRMKIKALRFSTIRIGRGASDEDEDDEERRFSWASLVRSLESLGSTIDSCEPDELAARVNDFFESDQPFDTRELQRDLRAAALAAQREGGETGTQQQRLRRFIRELSPGLRSSLLAVDRRRSSAWLRSLSDFVESWPTEEIVDALEHIDRSNRDVSKSALLIFSRLAKVSLTDPDLANRVGALASEWSDNAQPEAKEGDENSTMLASLSELLLARNQSQINPEEYEEALSRIAIDVERHARPIQHADLLDPKELKLHAAAIATQLLLYEGAFSTDHPRLLESMRESADAMIDSGSYGHLLEGTEAARGCLDGADPDTIREAEAYLEHLAEDERFARLIAPLSLTTEPPSELIELVWTVGPRAVGAVLRRLTQDCSSRVHCLLADLILKSDQKQLARALAGIVDDDAAILRRLAPCLDRFDAAAARTIMAPMLEHPNPNVRRTALGALVRPHDPVPLDILRRALRDVDVDVQQHAFRLLVRSRDEEAPKLAFMVLSGRLDGRRPSPAVLEPAIRALLNTQRDEFRDCLCEVLAVLGRSPAAIDERLPHLIAGALKAHRSDARVRRALLRWRLAPSRTASMFRRSPRPSTETKR